MFISEIWITLAIPFVFFKDEEFCNEKKALFHLTAYFISGDHTGVFSLSGCNM